MSSPRLKETAAAAARRRAPRCRGCRGCPPPAPQTPEARAPSPLPPLAASARPVRNLETFMARRYLAGAQRRLHLGHRRLFLSSASFLGVATLIVVLAVMNGFRKDLVSRILGFNGHITYFPDGLEAGRRGRPRPPPARDGGGAGRLPDDPRAAPRRARRARLRHRAARLRPPKTSPRGARSPPRSPKTSSPPSPEAACSWASAWPSATILPPATGSRSSTRTATAPFSALCRAKGRLRSPAPSPSASTNTTAASSSPPWAKRSASCAATASTRSRSSPRAPRLQRPCGPAWRDPSPRPGASLIGREANTAFTNALKVERNVMFLILSLIILVAAFNIVSGQYMLVKAKTGEIAILRTIGMSRGSVMRIFLMSGGMIGAAGTAGGWLLGGRHHRQTSASSKAGWRRSRAPMSSAARSITSPPCPPVRDTKDVLLVVAIFGGLELDRPALACPAGSRGGFRPRCCAMSEPGPEGRGGQRSQGSQGSQGGRGSQEGRESQGGPKGAGGAAGAGPASDERASLRLEGVGRRFRQGGSEVRVLEEVSLSVHPGELVALVGASGQRQDDSPPAGGPA